MRLEKPPVRRETVFAATDSLENILPFDASVINHAITVRFHASFAVFLSNIGLGN